MVQCEAAVAAPWDFCMLNTNALLIVSVDGLKRITNYHGNIV